MKRVVFASGKGGTGKTTLTAAVAHVVAAEEAVVLADCDVEAANLPIALGATGVTATAFGGASKAVIGEGCTGCGACARVCRFDAILPPENFYRDRTFRIDEYSCEGCGVCGAHCPAGAIGMEQVQGGEVCSASSAAGPIAFGNLYPGEDLSGKLVTEVRTCSDALAESTGARVTLIDGPPGVGCPAIASITNTDFLVGVTEPTVSGEHDLLRLVALARRLGVPMAVVLNKADLSASGAERIRAAACGAGLEVIAEIPFDPAFGQALVRLARDGRSVIADGPVARAALEVWREVRTRLA